MVDPYNRLAPGTPPGKGPSLFSPLRPVKFSFYLFLCYFRWATDVDDWWETPAQLFLLIFHIVPVVMGFKIIGAWVFLIFAAYVAGYVFVYAAFHLDDDDSWNDWKDKLLS